MSFLNGAKAAGKVPARPAPASAAKPAQGRGRQENKPRPGRYGGLGAAKPRAERLRDGRYRVKIIATHDFDGRNHDFFRIKAEVLAAGEGAVCKPGVEYLIDYMVDKGDMLDMNGPKVVSFVMTCLGYATEEDFSAAFPEESQAREDLMNRAAGVELDETDIGPNPCGGTILLVHAYGNGRVAEDGSEYQNYAWYPDEPEEGAA